MHSFTKTMNSTAELVRPKPLSLQDQVTNAYEEYREDLYRYLLLLGLSPSQAQETAQDTFLRMYLALRGGTQGGPTRIRHTRAWIFTVAHNLALNLHQAEQSIHLFEFTDDSEPLSASPDPERQAIDNQRNSRLHDALASLSDQQRHCLLLRAEGFRYREIADIIGVGTSTVGEFLRRAISRLRKTVYE
jgi:RNA polymerase sigma-70 factor (ECF subfamily)